MERLDSLFAFKLKEEVEVEISGDKLIVKKLQEIESSLSPLLGASGLIAWRKQSFFDEVYGIRLHSKLP